MQTKMFVFIGHPPNFQKLDLDVLMNNLNSRLALADDSQKFSRKEHLLLTRISGVSYYVAYMLTEDEIADWIQLANDAELSGDVEKINKEALLQRYKNSKRAYPNLYTDEDYSNALKIFETMTEFLDTPIISFQ